MLFKKGASMWFGFFLVALGILFLLKNIGIIHGDIWDWVWPILIICIGIGIMVKPRWYNLDKKSKKNISEE